MENIINHYIYIWNETEKIEKSNEFITTKLIKILGLRGHIVSSEFIKDVELKENIKIDNKINFVFNHNSYKCYFKYKNKEINIPYENVMDIVNFVNLAELLYKDKNNEKE